MLKSGPSSENKRDTFRLNPFHIYLDTCSKFNQNMKTRIPPGKFGRSYEGSSHTATGV